jgi:TetR/AcrR family transcriptional repressor of nem operon
MEEAGLTPGGFYAHFDSKETLLAEALVQAAGQSEVRDLFVFDGLTGHAWVEAFVDRYLSASHLKEMERGCPLAALVSEVSRSDDRVKGSFEAIVRGLGSELGSHVDGDQVVPLEGKALAIIAICIGGIGMARSVRDEMLAETILESCRHVVRRVLEDDIESGPTDRPRASVHDEW